MLLRAVQPAGDERRSGSDRFDITARGSHLTSVSDFTSPGSLARSLEGRGR